MWTCWQDKRFRFLVRLVAVIIAILRLKSGYLTLDEVIDAVLLGLILTIPFQE
jgi:hypothetical protein